MTTLSRNLDASPWKSLPRRLFLFLKKLFLFPALKIKSFEKMTRFLAGGSVNLLVSFDNKKNNA